MWHSWISRDGQEWESNGEARRITIRVEWGFCSADELKMHCYGISRWIHVSLQQDLVEHLWTLQQSRCMCQPLITEKVILKRSTGYRHWQVRAHYTSSSQHSTLATSPTADHLLFFKCICDTGPGYFNGVCTPLADIPGRSSLRAADRGDLLVSSTKTKIGSRSFRIAAPTVWNSLPLFLRHQTLSERQFRSGL